MAHNGTRTPLTRGQRVDLYITTIRNDAEDAYGAAFDEAAALARKLEDPGFTDEQFDSAVMGLICSVVLRTRPLPKFLRKSLGVLLQVTPEERADLIPVPVVGKRSSVQARTDRTTIDFVIDQLKENLYSPRSFAGPFTDLGCGLDGLKLTWRRDILGEADGNGIISVEALKRIRSKLAVATAVPGNASASVLFDRTGKATRVADDPGSRDNERRFKLIEVVEHAIGINSTITCLGSHVREDRISQAYARSPISRGRTA
jgi:hypothetical protein